MKSRFVLAAATAVALACLAPPAKAGCVISREHIRKQMQKP